MVKAATIYPEDELLSLPEAARLLGVVSLTARVWVLRGKLPGRDIGHGRFVIRRADVDAYLSESGRCPAA
jgi:excisionase family DNA binding protein